MKPTLFLLAAGMGSRYGGLKQLDGLMTAAYSNKKNIRELVAAMVSTYHPANAPVTIVKDNKYVAMVAGKDN